ncbi:MAG: 23S rRNA (pseudouridine(1915)-N(3))-methyltransferase RlmH [Syntrophobacterales bacterium]|nr:23S rRNA (pseudouridine(1915)-N(3))-methyltransferase RlmH [Syntrophobacterales bacterium]
MNQEMELNFVFVGKTAFTDVEQTIRRYLKKIRGFVPVHVNIVREEREAKHRNPEEVMDKEAERILRAIGKNAYLVSWDRSGKLMTSEEYALLLRNWLDRGIRSVYMVVGGQLGLSPIVLKVSQEIISLSPMTFPHDLVRAIIAEQTYRAMTIIHGVPYHR